MSTVITSTEWYTNPQNHVIVRNDGVVFTSPVEPNCPPQPHPDVDRDPDWISSEEPFYFRENLERYPQFAFIPKHPQLVGPLLARLANCTVVQGPHGRYGLDCDVLKSWFWLEDTLAAAIAALSHRLCFPLTVDTYSYPRQADRYARVFKTKYVAIRCVHMARQSFLIMIGLFSMLFSYRAERHFHHTAVPGSESHPTVQTTLRTYAHLSDATIQDLVDMHAVLGKRIGLIVVPNTCKWFLQLRHALSYANASFWIRWGVLTKPQAIKLKNEPPALWGSYIPEPQIIARCLAVGMERNARSMCSEQLLMEDRKAARAVQESLGVPDDSFPDLSVPPALQTSKDMPFGYIRWHEEKDRARREKASPEELALWNQRQTIADKPTWTHRSQVFHWPKITGVRTRMRVDRSQIKLAWEVTQYADDRTPGQRKYSAVCDEWDICTEFDASEDPASEAEPTAESTADDPEPQPERWYNREGLIVPPPEPVPPGHNDQGVLEAHATGLAVEELDMPVLDAVLFRRYGFLVEELGKGIQEGSFTVTVPTMNTDKVSRIIMEKNVSSTPLAEPAASYIVTALTQGLSFPDTYWDIRNGRLRDQNPGFFKFLPLTLSELGGNAVLKGYTVNPTSYRYVRPWVLFFESSVTAAQCLRESWGPSLEDALVKACQNGFRIHLFLVVSEDQLPPQEFPRPKFERRQRKKGHAPCHFDFNSYQRIVQSLIEEPRLRATVLQGGILGRICAPYISLDDVAEGPSNSAVRYGSRWRGGQGQSGIIFVEDFVSQEEIELLCGHIYIDNGGCALFLGCFPHTSLARWSSRKGRVILPCSRCLGQIRVQHACVVQLCRGQVYVSDGWSSPGSEYKRSHPYSCTGSEQAVVEETHASLSQGDVQVCAVRRGSV
jgi:hypothetical protein